MMHGADERCLVRLPSQLRKMFRHAQTGKCGGNRLKLATDLSRRVGLHIPHIQMARPTVEMNDDAGIGLGVQRSGPFGFGRQQRR